MDIILQVIDVVVEMFEWVKVCDLFEFVDVYFVDLLYKLSCLEMLDENIFGVFEELVIVFELVVVEFEFVIEEFIV